jgi:predicted Zn-dependent protease
LFWKAWDSLSVSLETSDTFEDSVALPAELARSREYINLIASIRDRDITRLNQAIVNFSLTPSTRVAFPEASQRLAAVRDAIQKDGAFDRTVPNIHSSAEQELFELPSTQQEAPLSNYGVFEQVRRQIDGIRKLLFTGNLSNVDRAVNELLDFHGRHGEKEHLAKSLCSLTKIALDANEPHMADIMSSRAMELGLDDIVVFTSRAEALKALARFSDATALYEETIRRFGSDRYALCGYADTLKDQGDLAGALRVYQTARDSYPEDPVASNGIVGVLWAKGESTRALEAAKQNVRVYGDVVSRIIYGNTLRLMGRISESVAVFAEALKKFDHEPGTWYGHIKSLRLSGRINEALTRCAKFQASFPDIPLPYLIQGEILRSENRLDESLSAYSAALKRFTSHRPAQIGKASTLILMDRESEAAQLLTDIEPESEIDWVAYHTLCLSILKSGRTDESIERLEKGLSMVPWQRVKRMLSDSLGYALTKQGRPVEAIKQLEIGLSDNDQSRRTGVLYLLSGAYAMAGDAGRAQNLLAVTPTSFHSAVSVVDISAAKARLKSTGTNSQPLREKAVYRFLLSDLAA